MSEITIQGYKFDIPADPSVVAGAVLDDNMAASLQQARLDNVRNNFAAKIKKLLNGNEELTEEQLAQARQDVLDYAAGYKFGVRARGTGPRMVDPVEREMTRLAKEDIAAAFFARHGERLTGEQVTEAAGKLLDAKHDEYMRRARRNLADKEKAGADVLTAAGLTD